MIKKQNTEYEKKYKERMGFKEEKLIARLQPEEMKNHTLPYPYFISEDGLVGYKALWQGTPQILIGFSDKPKAGEVNLSFEEFKQDMKFAKGKYPVFKNSNNSMMTDLTPIEEVEIYFKNK